MTVPSQWANFYLALAAGSATLAGFIFLATNNSFRAWATHPVRRLMALQTYAHFFLPFLFSMIALAPEIDVRFDAVIVAGLGLSIEWQLRSRVKHHPELLQADFEKEHHYLFSVSASLYVSLLIVSFGLPQLIGLQDVLWDILALLLLIMLFGGLLEVWDFYIHPPQIEEEPQPSFPETPNATRDHQTARSKNNKKILKTKRR